MYLIGNKVNANEVTIPDSAIRVRVVANSNSIVDQSMKLKVKHILEENLYTLLKNTKDIKVAREIINNNIENINNEIDILFKENNYNIEYKTNYGLNYFPKKNYRGINYDEGSYESLVVYIGEAQGDNWWCVLFPPLCLLETDKYDDVEYKFLVKEMINKIF